MLKKIIFIITLITLFSIMSAYGADKVGGYDIPVDMEINGYLIKCENKAVLEKNVTYIPLRSFGDAIGAQISWDSNQKAATMKKGNNVFVFYSGKNYSTVNGENSNYSAINYKNTIFVPARFVSEKMGYGVSWDQNYFTVKINAPGVEVKNEKKDYTYGYEDILYLGRIIQLESGYQSIRAKIGVGNVIVNRVRSNEFPNSVKGVIYDTRYGVQFPPAHSYDMTFMPKRECMIAAKLALNRTNIVGSSLYFVEAKYASYSWVHNNRKKCMTIDNTAFYY